MADHSTRSNSSVLDIKDKLAMVLEALEKCKEGKKTEDLKILESQLIDLQDRAPVVFQDRLEPLTQDFSFKVASRLSSFNSDISNLIENFQYTKISSEDNKQVFIEKVHQKRSAPISKLLYSKDFRTIYNIFVAILVNFGIAEIAKDYMDGSDFLGGKLVSDSFGKFDQAIKAWLGMSIWSYTTVVLIQQRGLNFFLTLFLHFSSLLILGFFAIRCVIDHQLPIATSIVVICEMFRICMKMHSYFREKILHGNGPNEYQKFLPKDAKIEDLVQPKIKISNFNKELSRYTYYLLCPTLIYRDSYPKIDRSIRWHNVSVHLFGFFGSIIYTTLIFKAFCVPEFRSASINIKDTHALILSWFRSMLPGTMVFMLLFFSVMHSWFSIWAEILNFADRKFYDDWWNSKDFGTFYRKISVTLYEWLHTYLFLDLQRFSDNRIGPNTARVIVFFVSGFICELILDVSLRMFMPYVFIIIAIPGAFMISFNSKRSRYYNVVMWTLLIMLMGMITMLYSLEHFSREKFPDNRNFKKYGVLAYLFPQCFYQIYN